jgi:DNA mismatch repair protein MutS
MRWLFCLCSKENNYCKPTVTDDKVMDIKNGQQVIEQQHTRESYVPNDLQLDDETQQIIIITGPNMAGVFLLRQTALISLMSQQGPSFLPRVLNLVWWTRFSRELS